MNEEPTQAVYTCEVTNSRAYIVFGFLLRFLCQRANITQDELEERGEAYRTYLFVKGYLKPEHAIGALDQDAIASVIDGTVRPSFHQVQIWVHILEEGLNSEKCKQIRRDRNLPISDFTPELKADLFHLAGFSTPEEMVESYERSLYMFTES